MRIIPSPILILLLKRTRTGRFLRLSSSSALHHYAPNPICVSVLVIPTARTRLPKYVGGGMRRRDDSHISRVHRSLGVQSTKRLVSGEVVAREVPNFRGRCYGHHTGMRRANLANGYHRVPSPNLACRLYCRATVHGRCLCLSTQSFVPRMLFNPPSSYVRVWMGHQIETQPSSCSRKHRTNGISREQFVVSFVCAVSADHVDAVSAVNGPEQDTERPRVL